MWTMLIAVCSYIYYYYHYFYYYLEEYHTMMMNCIFNQCFILYSVSSVVLHAPDLI